ncbi:hypothetical protein TK90_0216 [Thioalkalivibrio sp. K90mix]|uniref:type IV pilus modification PilV family protein n=1 Tax=Thioalkalivibrio sp. (strain K90mix) TaxID=396595 RepID=UPI000195A385|nr:hypothetical protein [Thioalkalivibrio sp. K90mix]ADC70731.1 hypothetical protein TK90_0216 [Thioalkalivibrio sp. K90mix]
MHNHTRFRVCGISLIEALIAIAVVSVGLLAIARLHGDLLSSAGDSKARAEAMQIAETEIEKLRNASTLTDLNRRLENVRTEAPGRNADYTLEWSNLPDTSDFGFFEPEVRVTWIDRRGDAQSVLISTAVAWSNPRFSVAAARADSEGGNFLNAPTGRARMGGGELLEGTDVTTVTNVIEGTSIEDGTETRQRDGEVQLVRDGEVVMTMDTTNPGELFSTISGRVYYGGTISLNPVVTRVLSSDAGFCTRRGQEPLGSALKPFVDSASGYSYFYYQCYVGEGWYGNVGIVRQENANPNDRSCVGDHLAEETSAWDSREPRTSSNRFYRSFIETTSGIRAIGIGITPAEGDSQNPTYVAQNLTSHDFMLTRFRSGNNRPRDCFEALEDGEGAFEDNAGRHVCLYEGGMGCGTDDGDSLPQPGDQETTLVAGNVEQINSPTGNSRPVLEDLTFDSVYATCGPNRESLGQGRNEVESITSYECVIDWEGWTGETWSSDMILTLGPNTKLCDVGTAELGGGTVTKSGDNVLIFDRISQTEALQFDFAVAHEDADCP